MPACLQCCAHGSGNAGFHTDVRSGVHQSDTRCLNRRLNIHAVFNEVQHHLQRRLKDTVAAGGPDRGKRVPGFPNLARG